MKRIDQNRHLPIHLKTLMRSGGSQHVKGFIRKQIRRDSFQNETIGVLNICTTISDDIRELRRSFYVVPII